ncbi:helix-turn-helix domain-containing protein [Alicyclobacillus mali (ex Roth et al. 2021)]|uniref:helix-turn-helix domain-containing protein n=1 Tax=Alicyclobacillus mali (ex Roth et al. 2021) TaxID=1123961 RepID=UPI001A8E1BBE|nr:helix-turn-helix domain-containing protein [Alicyclobacillus mali (ex Roth et al. 2021)]
MAETDAYVIQLWAHAIGLPCWVVSKDLELTCGNHDYEELEGLSEAVGAFIRKLPNGDLANKPSVALFRHFERFVVAPTETGWILLGPGSTHPVSLEEIDRAVQDGMHDNVPISAFRKYASQLTPIPHRRWLAAARAMAHVFGKSEPLDESIPVIWVNPQDAEESKSEQIDDIWPDEAWFETHRYRHTPAHNLEIERRVFQFVRDGDEEGLLAFRVHMRDERSGIGILSKHSELRNRTNLGICSITLATRVAVSEGVDVETAYSMSDAWIQTLEDATSLVDVEKTIDRALGAFARAVHVTRVTRYSRPVREATAFLRQHVTAPLRMADVSAHVGLHLHHLAELFKRETGRTLRQALSEFRMQRAMELLRETHLSIGEIAAMLQFSDQSHFTRCFRQYTGATPKTFRDGRISMDTKTQATDTGIRRGE